MLWAQNGLTLKSGGKSEKNKQTRLTTRSFLQYDEALSFPAGISTHKAFVDISFSAAAANWFEFKSTLLIAQTRRLSVRSLHTRGIEMTFSFNAAQD